MQASILNRSRDADREARIREYARRAARGLPLFESWNGAEPKPNEPDSPKDKAS
jgi:hypothetical protein